MPQRSMRFLVFASPKSGTTWLQRLLSAHPMVHCGETRLFGRHIDPSRPSGLGITLESYVENLQRHFHAPRPAVPGGGSFQHELMCDLADQIARTTLRVSGKSIYGEKLTPYLGTASHALRQASRYSPRTRLIFLVRDGRDVVVSGAAQWNNLTRATTAAAPAAAGVDERYVEMFTQHWIEAACAYSEVGDEFDHTLLVRYEDMLADPEAQAARLLQFIGADASGQLVSECVAAASFERLSGGRQRGDEDASSFFRKGTAGDWRAKLSREQAARFERVAGRWLRAYGYATTGEVRTEPKPAQATSPPALNAG
ncbi:MAG: sulfotransferase domain-containing protein [Phycisphaerales bacterium]